MFDPWSCSVVKDPELLWAAMEDTDATLIPLAMDDVFLLITYTCFWVSPSSKTRRSHQTHEPSSGSCHLLRIDFPLYSPGFPSPVSVILLCILFTRGNPCLLLEPSSFLMSVTKGLSAAGGSEVAVLIDFAWNLRPQTSAVKPLWVAILLLHSLVFFITFWDDFSKHMLSPQTSHISSLSLWPQLPANDPAFFFTENKQTNMKTAFPPPSTQIIHMCIHLLYLPSCYCGRVPLLSLWNPSLFVFKEPLIHGSQFSASTRPSAESSLLVPNAFHSLFSSHLVSSTAPCFVFCWPSQQNFLEWLTRRWVSVSLLLLLLWLIPVWRLSPPSN